MKTVTNEPENTGTKLTPMQIGIGVFGLLAPFLTFLLAVSGMTESVKIFVLVVLAVGYSVICLWAFQRSHSRPSAAEPEHPAESSLALGLNAIGEATEFFGSSLKPPDLFRLVSSRVAQVFPFVGSALFVLAESGNELELAYASGPGSDALAGIKVPLDRGIAGMAWVSGEVEIDSDRELDSDVMPADRFAGARSVAAVPLMHEGRVFAVLCLYTAEPLTAEPDLLATLRSIGERVAPLFVSSMSFERSLSNALTDPLTNLPNERAFYLVLENQLAESHRSRDERPLSVIVVDIKGFAEANKAFGFSTGDRMLAFVADRLASSLRKMDFLARSAADEFLIILPTASEDFTVEITNRLRENFASEAFAASEDEEVKVWLNLGYATFWKDGETAEQLLQSARVRKQQAKAEEQSKLLWFPKEYVN